MTLKNIIKTTALTLLASGTAQALSVKVLYSYTEGTEAMFGGKSNVETKLQLMHRMNKRPFANSKTSVNILKAGFFKCSYDDVTDGPNGDEGVRSGTTMMYRMESSRFHTDLRAEKIRTKASLVHLYALDADMRIWGNTATTLMNGWQSHLSSGLLGQYNDPIERIVPAHEMGHQFGGSHGEGFELVQAGKGANGADLIRDTVLRSGGARGSQRLLCFSSPTQKYYGHTVGDANHDNRSIIRANRKATKNLVNLTEEDMINRGR